MSRHPHRKDYTDAERERALVAWVLAGGHADRSAELLKESQGLEIPATTIRHWAKYSHTELLTRIQAEVMPQVRAEQAIAHQQLGASALDAEARAIEKLVSRMDELEPRDLSGVARNMAVAAGIHVDKSQLLTGQATSIVKHDLGEITRSIKSKGVDLDVTDAEVVSEELVPA